MFFDIISIIYNFFNFTTIICADLIWCCTGAAVGDPIAWKCLGFTDNWFAPTGGFSLALSCTLIHFENF